MGCEEQRVGVRLHLILHVCVWVSAPTSAANSHSLLSQSLHLPDRSSIPIITRVYTLKPQAQQLRFTSLDFKRNHLNSAFYRRREAGRLPPLPPMLVSDRRPLCCPEAPSAAPAPHTAAASGSPAPAPCVEKIGKHGRPHLNPNPNTGQQVKQNHASVDDVQQTYCTQSAGPCSVPFCCPG